jgi:hypothetical protein
VLPRAHRRTPDRDSTEQILRHEVSRALKKLELSPQEEQDIERLGYSLVAKLLLGPISEVMARVEIRASQGEGRQGGDRAIPTSETSLER